MKTRKNSAFTLIEIMTVIVIISLLITLGIPGYLQARKKARRDTCVNNLRMIENAADQYRIEHNLTFSTNVDIQWLWPSSSTGKDITSYIDRQLSCPAGGSYVGGDASTGNANTDKRSDTELAANSFPHCVTSGTVTNFAASSSDDKTIEHSIERDKEINS